MILSKLRALACTLLVCAAPSVVSAQDFTVEANGARAQDRWGGEFGVGYNLHIGPVTVRPIGGVFLHASDNDRFRSETISDGREVCRDHSNGQFADKSNCNDLAAKLYGRIEGTLTVLAVEVGAGARFSGDRTRAYGTAAMNVLPKVKIKGNLGDRYGAIGLMATF